MSDPIQELDQSILAQNKLIIKLAKRLREFEEIVQEQGKHIQTLYEANKYIEDRANSAYKYGREAYEYVTTRDKYYDWKNAVDLVDGLGE